MHENILSWNITNWVTVVLMAAIIFVLLKMGMKYFAPVKAASFVEADQNTDA